MLTRFVRVSLSLFFCSKSSLLQSLFRLYDIASDGGSILVDGVDICSISPRSEWRKRVAVITQTPVLFSGTLRDNLTPYDDDEDSAQGAASVDHPRDEEVWAALRACRLEARVRAMPLGLDTPITEEMHLSVGERQLICFARAMLKKKRIVVLDEATASVDLVTDAHIQALTLQLPATVLLIAHRLSSVMQLDRVIVMHEGRVAECESPQKLAADPNSMFAQLLRLAQAQQADAFSAGASTSVEQTNDSV